MSKQPVAKTIECRRRKTSIFINKSGNVIKVDIRLFRVINMAQVNFSI